MPETRYPIISIFGSRILKDLLDLLFGRAHLLRTLFNIQAREGSCLDSAQQNISALRFLHTGFYRNENKSINMKML